MGKKPQSQGAVGAGLCAQLKRPRCVERRMVTKSGGGSLLGEEMRLGNLKGHWSGQCLSIGDVCWMAVRGLDRSHSWREAGVGGTVLFLCPYMGWPSETVWGVQRGLDMGGQGRAGYASRSVSCTRGARSRMRSVGKAGRSVKKDQGCRDGRGGLGCLHEKQWRFWDAGAYVAQE